MQSEVRKVLEKHPYYITGGVYEKLDAAERADAARREEPVQALRQAVAELVAKWEVCALMEPRNTASAILNLLAELNAIIATKPDTVENRQATASGPVHDVTPADAPKESDRQYVTATGPVQNVASSEAKKTRNFGDVIRKKLQENPELAEQVADEHIRAIAEETVRDAMPDVLDGLAETHKERGWYGMADGIKRYAAKLRKERATWN